MTPEVNALIKDLLLGIKLNALKLTLSEKQLEIYNNHILDEVEKIKPNLIKVLGSVEQVDEVLKAFLK